jgi:hypothetical protein
MWTNLLMPLIKLGTYLVGNRDVADDTERHLPRWAAKLRHSPWR